MTTIATGLDAETLSLIHAHVPRVRDAFRAMAKKLVLPASEVNHRAAALKSGPHSAHGPNRNVELIEAKGSGRECFYHFRTAARGRHRLTRAQKQSRRAISTTRRRANAVIDRARRFEPPIVDNRADGAYLYPQMLQEHHPRGQQVLLDRLRWIGGRNSSGAGMSSINFHRDGQGDIRPGSSRFRAAARQRRNDYNG